MQLVAYGAQDIYLTGNPQITFFKVVYRRHTNFSMECIQQTINGASQLSATSTSVGTVTVSRNGDLVNKVWVRCDQDTTDGVSGDKLISQVECEIGGQLIDRHYEEWLQVWAELTTPAAKADGYKYLTGGFTNNLGTIGGGTNQQSIMIPLQFWFCRNPGLALPLIALQYHEVKLKFTWNSTNSNARDDGNYGTQPTCEVWVDYIYLDTDERRRFAQVSHEYLIEQVQRQSEDKTGISFKLNFNHPVKELIWTNDTTATAWTSQKAKLVLNGHDRFAQQDREYFQLRQPFEYHTSVPGFNIKETERPQLLTNQQNLLGNVTPVDSCEASGTASAAGKFTIDAGTRVLNYKAAADPGIKVGDLLMVSYATTANAEGVAILTTVESITTAYSNNSTAALIVLQADGTTELVDSTAGDGQVHIVGRTQDPQSRCSQLAKNINCYSFALKPEEHQPSGTCNFSRIDNAKLDFNTTTSVSVIYAVNYNVLRIMSGMGGLAYSN